MSNNGVVRTSLRAAGHDGRSTSKMKQNLNYNDPNAAVNFRDVGEFVNLIAGESLLPERHIFRGGTIKVIYDPRVIGDPRTIFCLQKGPDHDLPGVRNVHFPISNDYEKYDTSVPEVRRWLKSIVRAIEMGIDYPLYIHCLSGRDRTGVVVAALLKICGVKPEHIIEEYHLSIGTEKRAHIHITLTGIEDIYKYFNGVDLAVVRASIQNRN